MTYVRPNAISICRWLVAIALGCFSLSVHAAYSTAAPPSGWSKSAAGNSQLQSFLNDTLKKSGASTFVEKRGVVTVAGKRITVPLAYQANTPAAMRSVAGALFRNPYTYGAGAAVGAAALICDMGICEKLMDQGVSWAEDKGWLKESEPSYENSGYKYFVSGAQLYSSPSSAVMGYLERISPLASFSITSLNYLGNNRYFYEATCTYNGNSCGVYSGNVFQTCPGGISCNLESGKRPLTAEEFAELAPEWAPYFNPQHYPEALPVPAPVMNPDPADPLKSRPVFVETGSPQVTEVDTGNNTKTRTTTTPGVEITHAPGNTPDTHHRVDVQPKNEVKRQEISVNPETGQETVISEQSDSENKPPDDTEGLCDRYPEILACAEVPEAPDPDNEDIDVDDQDVEYEPENLFASGVCPADAYSRVGGQNILVWDWKKTCGYASDYAKPIILILSTLAALGILIPKE